MKFNFNIPPELAHLKLDERGYPIPFFVPMVNGKPEFKYQDAQKRAYCIEQHKCSICGKYLRKEESYIVTGPLGYKNRVTSDAPMHLVCAKFTIEVCPHLHYEKAQYKTEDAPWRVKEKPKILLLVRIRNLKVELNRELDKNFLTYKPVSFEKYEYRDNILVKSDNNDL